MNLAESGGRRRSLATITAPVLVGLVVLVLLFPASGITPQPPVCYSAFGYVVPCDAGWSPAAALAAAFVAGVLLWRLGRHPRRA